MPTSTEMLKSMREMRKEIVRQLTALDAAIKIFDGSNAKPTEPRKPQRSKGPTRRRASFSPESMAQFATTLYGRTVGDGEVPSDFDVIELHKASDFPWTLTHSRLLLNTLRYQEVVVRVGKDAQTKRTLYRVHDVDKLKELANADS